MRLPRVHIGLLVVALVAAAIATSAGAATASCVLEDQSTDEVLPGVVLTWDSSFLCADAPNTGDDDYQVTVNVSNAATSTQGVTIAALELSHTTPRPRGVAPAATASASGLPVSLAPGESGSFTVSGDYELVTTDEGDKANLHLTASGSGASTGDPFELGINVQLRGTGAEEDGGDGDDGTGEGGKPSWAGTGPPPWAGPLSRAARGSSG